MKKIYTTLVLMLAASFAFAQVPAQKVLRTEASPEIKMEKRSFNNLNSQKPGAAEWWYMYAESMEYEDYGFRVMLQDTIATCLYNDGNGGTVEGRPQMLGWAQTFDFTSPEWESFFFFDALEGAQIPDLRGAETVYSIDSLAFAYAYMRVQDGNDETLGETFANDDVDTMTLTVFGGVDEADNAEDLYAMLITSDLPEGAFTQTYLGYDKSTSTISEDTLTPPIFYSVDIPLSWADTSSYGSYKVFDVTDVPELQNITSKNISLSITFKSGKANRQLSDVIGRDINRCVFLCMDDMADYSWGSQNAVEHTNCSMNVMEWTWDPESWFYDMYVSNVIWNGPYMRPAIGIAVSSEDCPYYGETSVEEFVNNITVRPNPATNYFIVDLGAGVESQVELFNLVGQKVFSETTANSNMTVNTNDLKAGIYMLKVTQNGAVQTTKVVLN